MKTFSINEQLDVAGFAVENVLAGEPITILTRDFLTSNEPRFYTFIRNISSLYLYAQNVRVDQVTQFLVVIHANRTVDLYLDHDLKVALEISSKRDVIAGEVVRQDNIADIRRMKFLEVNVAPTDKVIYCFKVGWKFALFFDLSRPEPLDVDRMELALGDLYRSLSFEAVYETLAADALTEEMLKDGWFPFLELLEDPFRILATSYKEKHDVAGATKKVVDSFTPERLQHITERWWRNPVIAEHRAIFEAGVNAFLAGNEAGQILCIKTIGSEIEGILRRQQSQDTGGGQRSLKPAIAHIVGRGRARAASPRSLFLPDAFRQFLEANIFGQFDQAVATTAVTIPLNRHSSSHGAAEPATYTRARALQMILVVDQLAFYTL